MCDKHVVFPRTRFHGIEESDWVFFTDEAWFHLSGYVNSQNKRIWSYEDPHVTWKALALSENWSVGCCIMLSNSGPNILWNSSEQSSVPRHHRPICHPQIFFPLGVQQRTVYKNNLHTPDDLKRNIMTAINNITLQVLHKVPPNTVNTSLCMHWWTGKPFWAYAVRTWFDFAFLRCKVININSKCCMSCSLCIKPAKYNCLVWCVRLFDLSVYGRKQRTI